LQNKGILIQPLYQEVWQSSGIDPEEIIELLVHFRLAAPVQTELSRFKPQYFLPAVLPGYTGDPNEVHPGYELRASPVHITFSTGYVPPGFFTCLATAVATNPNFELSFDDYFAASAIHSKSIYRNRVYFSYGCPSDNFVLTDINEAIQVDVMRYVPENSHPVPFKTVCQNIMKLLEECCQKVEDTLTLYHNGSNADRSSRRVQYMCQCSRSSEVHYIKNIDAEKQICSEFVHCKMESIPRRLTINELMWFKKISARESNDDQQEVMLTIANLVDIIRVLEKSNFQNQKWRKLGLYLGLIHPELKTIEDNYPRDAERCLEECLAEWLKNDTEATWEKLAIAVGEAGEKSAATYIRSEKTFNR
ncbi:PREDICTED: uncharacterized protein LOC109591456, partial [Amphimedon queenslandica]|uniref:uncharacterized protein LOC109591456 n=1 Tax=Amphimedon queenslandica TaxID=400682 RepID=UPI00096AE8F3